MLYLFHRLFAYFSGDISHNIIVVKYEVYIDNMGVLISCKEMRVWPRWNTLPHMIVGMSAPVMPMWNRLNLMSRMGYKDVNDYKVGTKYHCKAVRTY